MYKISTDTAIENVIASFEMEGLKPSEETIRECKRVLSGEISKQEYVDNIRKKYMKPQPKEDKPNGNIRP